MRVKVYKIKAKTRKLIAHVLTYKNLFNELEHSISHQPLIHDKKYYNVF